MIDGRLLQEDEMIGYAIRWRRVNEVVAGFELFKPYNTEWTMVFRGAVKWDGCANVETDPDCMLHICGPEGWEPFCEALREISKQALRVLDRKEYG